MDKRVTRVDRDVEQREERREKVGDEGEEKGDRKIRRWWGDLVGGIGASGNQFNVELSRSGPERHRRTMVSWRDATWVLTGAF
jgi:hypothetical protein